MMDERMDGWEVGRENPLAPVARQTQALPQLQPNQGPILELLNYCWSPRNQVFVHSFTWCHETRQLRDKVAVPA